MFGALTKKLAKKHGYPSEIDPERKALQDFKRRSQEKLMKKYGKKKTMKEVFEDAVPVNNISGGNVAGTGGDSGEPGARKKKRILRRASDIKS
jgi:hypothetical protein